MTCGHTGEHQCKTCGHCNSCRHTYVERADGWWKRCPTFKWVKIISRGGHHAE